MKNIELKVRTKDFGALRRSLKRIKATRKGILEQRDVYFRSKRGRLKLRTIDNAHSELIYYERPNKKESKLSAYDRCAIAPDQARGIRRMLKETFGEFAIVVKKRELWIYKNTRIHLDTVRKLGTFVEFETAVDEKGTILEARAEHEEVIHLLNLSGLAKIKYSYSDLLKRK